MRSAVAGAFALLVVLLLPVRPAAAEWRSPGTRPVGVGLGTGAYVFLPYLVPVQDLDAEVVLGDCLAIGGKVLFALGEPGDAVFVPFIALGSARSRPSAAYLAAALLPGSALGSLGLGYEAALRGPVRLYGELGAVGALGGEFSALPYAHLGVRLRF